MKEKTRAHMSLSTRQKAEKDFRRMVHEERKVGSKSGELADSLFASTAKNFILAIPLEHQEKPVAMNETFKKSAKEEYPVKYLEHIGALVTEENVAMVKKHMGIQNNCSVSAAWKSRGSVADYLYVVPNWPNQESTQAGGGSNAKDAIQNLREKTGPELMLDYSIVNSTLARIEERRQAKLKAQQKKREEKAMPKFKSFRPSSSVLHTLTLLSNEMANEEEDDEENEGGNKNESKKDDKNDNGTTTFKAVSLQLRFNTYEKLERELALCTQTMEDMQRDVKLQDFHARLSSRNGSGKMEASEKRHREKLFDKERQLYPNRVTVRPKTVESKTCRDKNGKPIVLAVSKRAQTELAKSMKGHISQNVKRISNLITYLLHIYDESEGRNSQPRLKHYDSDLCHLVEVCARYAYRKCVVNKLEHRPLKLLEEDQNFMTASAKAEKLMQRRPSLVSDQPSRQASLTQRRPSIVRRRPSIDGNGNGNANENGNAMLGKRKSLSISNLLTEEQEIGLEVLKKTFLDHDVEESKLLKIVCKTYGRFKKQIMTENAYGSSELLHSVIFMVRVMVDAFMNSYYSNIMSDIIALEDRENGNNSKYTSEVKSIRVEYDQAICQVLDPGNILRISTGVLPNTNHWATTSPRIAETKTLTMGHL